MHPLVKDGVSAAFATIIITVFLEVVFRFRFDDSKSRAGYRRWIISVLASLRLSVSALPGATNTGDVNSPTNQPTSLPSPPYEISSSIVGISSDLASKASVVIQQTVLSCCFNKTFLNILPGPTTMGPTAPAHTSPPEFLDTLEDFTWSWKSGRAITLLIMVVCFAFVETALGFFALGDELRAKSTDPVEPPAPDQDVAAQDERDKLAVAIAAAVTTVVSVDLATTINNAVAAAVDAAVTAAINTAVAVAPATVSTVSTNVAVDPSADASITADSTGAGAAAVGSFAIRCDDRGAPGGATTNFATTSRDKRPILASSIIVANSLAIFVTTYMVRDDIVPVSITALVVTISSISFLWLHSTV
ncbi:hypothetical protein AOL_s00210g371 [Orbilia oligospora ATCC 24927]|uniref:Uncharacterized protein n=1 Tax=Arthrobotrys oligospora (strain ATCC 24927 / CBS 115.81 / DSM 1491) TaxID=756982 RepID=G1XSL2_ARTOA|nr:hypothetical protein AOL_s00210g371 [Orbilia oligospora ATCC 24927]EGX43924.1 hypothetical protein AOL_s00210g371 [Orbilia oligospora ATCC 24927]